MRLLNTSLTTFISVDKEMGCESHKKGTRKQSKGKCAQGEK